MTGRMITNIVAVAMVVATVMFVYSRAHAEPSIKSQGWVNLQRTWCLRPSGEAHGYRGSISDDDGTCSSYDKEASWTTWTRMTIGEDGYEWGNDGTKCRYLRGRMNYDKDFLFRRP